jgi:hypothetical protein
MRPLLILLTLLALAGCRTDGEGFSQQQPPPPPVDPNTLCIDAGLTQCNGAAFQICTNGRWVTQETCDDALPVCDPINGCAACLPDTTFCTADEIWQCDSAGSASLTHTCEATQECILGSCWDRCDQAEGTNSYLGCRFLAVPTANVLHPDFSSDFAVVVGNPSKVTAAEVSIRRGGTLVASGTVAPASSEAFQLDTVPALETYAATTREVGAAFEVATDLPVAAYQYNPLHFQAESGQYSFTNDASLLLPEHVLSGNYRVTSMPTIGIGAFPGAADFVPGFLAVAATEDGTLVEIQAQANTLGGEFGSLSPGETAVVSLNRGDVLQLFSERPEADLTVNVCEELGGTSAANGVNSSCLLEGRGDLSGTLISADKDVAVWSGHVCTFVPFDQWACDHLEEGMFPIETWGRRLVMTAPMRPEGNDVAPTLYRIVAHEAADVDFSGGVHDAVSMAPGDLVEFTTAADFVVNATAPISVSQFLLGQNAISSGAGDPAMGSGVPQAQWRNEYDFLVPETYSVQFISLVAPLSTAVYLDGTELAGWEPIPDSDFAVLRWEVDPGSHRLESVADVGFGLTSYGYAQYTSYLYPGGMNFLRGTTR